MKETAFYKIFQLIQTTSKQAQTRIAAQCACKIVLLNVEGKALIQSHRQEQSGLHRAAISALAAVKSERSGTATRSEANIKAMKEAKITLLNFLSLLL